MDLKNKVYEIFRSFLYWKDERRVAASPSIAISVSLTEYRKGRVISGEYRMKI
jgi:hypothetical protein